MQLDVLIEIRSIKENKHSFFQRLSMNIRFIIDLNVNLHWCAKSICETFDTAVASQHDGSIQTSNVPLIRLFVDREAIKRVCSRGFDLVQC